MTKFTVVLALLAAVLLLSTINAQDCACNCRRNRKPVCGQTAAGAKIQYDNDCLLECANRCENAGVTLVAAIECGIEEA